MENDGENNVEVACETIEGSEVTRPDPSCKQPGINKHSNTEANIRKNRKKKETKSKPKSPTQNPNQPTVNANTSDGVMNASTVVLNQRDKARRQLLLQGTQLLKKLTSRKKMTPM